MKYLAHIVLISFLLVFGLGLGAADAAGRVGPFDGFQTTATDGANPGFVEHPGRDANAVAPSGLLAATITLTSSPNPSQVGQPVTLTATVSGGLLSSILPVGLVNFSVDGNLLGSVDLAIGTATFSTSGFESVGTHTITATYVGDGLFASSSQALVQTVNPGATTTALVSSANPSVFGQPVTLTANISGTGGTPTGNVVFLAGGTQIGVGTIVTGSATLATSQIPAGNNSLVAVYSGDSNFAASTSVSLAQTVTAAATVTTLTSSQNPSIAGHSVTLSANVTSSVGTPSGSVTFLDGSTVLGISSLASGATSFTTAALTSGSHIITALYGAVGNFQGSTSATLSQVVNPGLATTSTVTVLTSSPNPATRGQSVTFSVTVTGTGGTPTGSVTFQDGSTTIGTTNLVGGAASFTTASFAAGNHSIIALYGGDSVFLSSVSSALSLTINQNVSTIALASTPNPSSGGQSITFTATASGAGGPPTGTVVFLDGATTLGSSTLTAGVASFVAPSLAVGSHAITASYGGDNNFLGSTSAALSQTVNASATTTLLVATPNPSLAGQAVTLTATISGTGGIPTGSVIFSDGGTALGAGNLTGGVATFASTSLTAGSHSLTASYSGGGNFLGSVSVPLTQTVNRTAATVTMIAAPNPSVTGQAVIFTATVTGTGGTPTGTVTFKDGAVILGTGTLNTGIATLANASLAAGNHSISATYSGDGNFLGAVSSALSQVVNQGSATTASTTTLTATPNPSALGQAVTLTATINGSGGTPTGSVIFQDGTTTLGTGTLTAGVASIAATSLTAGSHSITAIYGGDNTFLGSVSAALVQTITKGTATIALTASPNPSIAGQPTTFTVTVSGSGATPTGSVTIMDGATTLGTAALTAGVGTVTVTSLGAGNHSITVTYSGDGNFVGTTSAPTPQTVNQGTATIALVATPNPGRTGQAVTFTTTVSTTGGVQPTGTVTVKDGTTTLGVGSMTGGVASVAVVSLGAGSHSITATYSGDVNFVGGTSPVVALTVNQGPATIASTTNLASTANPAALGHPVTFTATVSGTGGTPTGSVTFKDGSTTLGTSLLSGSAASITVAAFGAGSHSIVAIYSGDNTFLASISAVLPQTIDQGTATATLVGTPNPSISGQTITFIATIAGSGGVQPTGSVIVKDGASVLGTATLTAGTATVATAALASGSHSITAFYSGDGNFPGSASATLVQTVNQSSAATASAVALISSSNPGTFGQSVTFTATVTGAGGTPTGAVAFKDGTKPLGSRTLTSGVASIAVPSLAAGSHSIVASYGGDSNFLGSTSGGLAENIDDPTVIAGVYTFQSVIGVTGVSGTDNGHFHGPVAGAIDPTNGHLFVADTLNHRVQVIDTSSFAVIATIGITSVPGADNAHLNLPGNVGYDSATARIFIADTGNHRIQIYDGSTFVYLATLGVSGAAGSDNAHFDLPTGARINVPFHQLYVADSGNDRVQIFDTDTLGYITTLGTSGVTGADNAHFNQPTDAEYNPSTGQLMVADAGNARIQLFDAVSLLFDATLGGPGGSAGDNSHFALPTTVAFDQESNLVVIADGGGNARVQVLDALSYNYVMTLGTVGSVGSGNSQFASPQGIVVDPVHSRLFIGDGPNNRLQVFSIGPVVNLASVLPDSRSVLLGDPATIFANIINTGPTPLEDCQIALSATAPSGLTLSYQTTNPATNAPIGTINTPATIAANDGLLSFIVLFQGTSAFSAPAMPLAFDCLGAAPATIITGVDTVDLVMSDTPIADIIALSATSTADGIVNVPNGGVGAFAVASINLGVTTQLTVSVDTGDAVLPVITTICQTNPATGQCQATPAASVSLNYVGGAAPTFSVFLQATSAIPFAPATSRIFVRFKDAAGGLHGSSSVAIDTF
ncbi:MAG: Ig-like domain repeat protein [Aliidongia sp.]